MLRFNRVFDELGIEYNDYVIPPDVLLRLEKKDSSKAIVAAESKKRKGGGAVKQVAKKRKAEVLLEAPVESSSARSSAAESNSVGSGAAEVAKAAPAAGVLEAQVSRTVSSVRAPFASLLGEDSSDADAPRASPVREASAGGGSPPKERQEESSDEAESVSARRIKRAEDPPRPVEGGINSLYIGTVVCFVGFDLSACFDYRGLILFVYFSEDVVAGLASAEELARGASIAQEGLAVPPPRNPAPSALASRPSPANVLGPGKLLTPFCFL